VNPEKNLFARIVDFSGAKTSKFKNRIIGK